MSKISIDEDSLSWWKEFWKKDKEAGERAEKYIKTADKEYRSKKIKEAEKEWRKTLSKVEKNWIDRFLISQSGIKDEKTLQAALDKANKEADDVITPSEKAEFFKFLLNSIGMLN